MPATNPPTPGRSHLYWIDWVRFLAAFLVLLDHACQANWSGPEVAVDPARRDFLRLLVLPTHLGREAVVVFFALSGALVGGLTLEKIRAGAFDFRAYAADRIARIHVPLIPALLLSMAILWIFKLPVLWWRFAGCLIGLQGVTMLAPKIDVVLWTLAYEVWFYVLAGCAGVLAAWPRQSRVARGAALAGGALSLWVLCVRLDWIYLVCWLVGAFGFGLRHRFGWTARPWVAVAGLALLAASVLGWWTDFLPLPPAGPARVREGISYLTLSLGTMMFVLGACHARPRTRVGAWLERTGTVLAAFSYTLYLTHGPLTLSLLWIDQPLPEIVTGASLFRLGWWLAFCLGAAWVPYALFERQTPLVRGWLRAAFGGGKVSRTEPETGRSRNPAGAYQRA